MVRQDGQPDRHRVVAVGQQPGHEHQVAERLGHLLAVQADHPGVHVVPREGVRVERHPGVRGAHLVVREDQVRAARLDVERGAQVLGGDRRALHVPAGPPLAEPGRPGRLVGPGPQPDQRVQRVLLAGTAGIAAALGEQLQHLAPVQPGHRAERVVAAPREVLVGFQVVQGAPVGEAAREALDDAEGLDRADQPGGRQHPQGRHVGAVAVDLAVGQLAPVLTVPGRPLQQRVVHVGHVLHVGHVMARVPPGSDQQVPGQERGGVPDMGGVVRGDPARVQRGVRPGRGDRQLAARRCRTREARGRAPAAQECLRHARSP